MSESRARYRTYETPAAGFGEHYAVQPDGLPGQPAEEHQHEVPHPGQGTIRRVWIHGRQSLCQGEVLLLLLWL